MSPCWMRRIRWLLTQRSQLRFESGLFIVLILGFIAFEVHHLARRDRSIQTSLVDSVLPQQCSDSLASSAAYQLARSQFEASQPVSRVEILSVENAIAEPIQVSATTERLARNASLVVSEPPVRQESPARLRATSSAPISQVSKDVADSNTLNPPTESTIPDYPTTGYPTPVLNLNSPTMDGVN